jgi:hypothetical protein
VQRWFAAHPQIGFARRGIAGFAEAPDIARQAAGGEEGLLWRVTSSENLAAPYAEAGRGRPLPAGKRAVPDAQARACALLAGAFPDATILLLTRGFGSVLLSGYSEYVRSGGDADFFALRADQPAGSHGGEHAWNYDYLIRLYREAFAGRVIVLPYELLRDDPGAFTAELERRLGVDRFEAPLDRLHPSLSPVELRWYPRITRLMRRLPTGRRQGSRLFASYVRSVRRNRWRRLVALLQRVAPGTPVTRELIGKDAIEYFRGRAEALADDPLYARYRDEYLLAPPRD